MTDQEYRQLVDELQRGYQAKKKENRHLLVCVSGIDASGKSTLAQRLQESLTERGMPVLPLSGDDFFFRRHVRYRNPDPAAGYYLDSCDYGTLFGELLVPLSRGELVRKTVTHVDWESDAYRETEYSVPEPSVIVVEGVFLLRRDLPDVFDYRIWLSLSFRAGVKRACSRERDLAYYGSVQAIRDRYLKRLYRGQLLHLQQDRPWERCQAVLAPSTPDLALISR
ncbi:MULTISPECIES: adenylyl-sulfate kinase [Paenibacillus]|uniref:adenylyl-sulfate kinase n=1 Tax=Paenibacillus TaxID=44249 RepID=UPI0022B8F73C|nr:adenylyl-sulfate kinase [Paenibacillus caseinilyticus]MCZ8517874.1 adenylyl-sulfate kinase [Paenibacillus caseinilyticus]